MSTHKAYEKELKQSKRNTKARQTVAVNEIK